MTRKKGSPRIYLQEYFEELIKGGGKVSYSSGRLSSSNFLEKEKRCSKEGSSSLDRECMVNADKLRENKTSEDDNDTLTCLSGQGNGPEVGEQDGNFPKNTLQVVHEGESDGMQGKERNI
ncbi:unnamed protein product [Lepeophtheirus salmonis]|uniref:(salmon louse) hypothetical protein n=1 Tax=Lepeophtheirus salmonis TaxID=72036 RepID=A0A7R8CNL2_LEPSM|nr:unnamed protein product [Lepeophtheirus salmonis]CAF2876291.1 unnamed protein product [Lepeophtheirus salmonis]